jgi:hypothetical protein
MKWFFFSLGFLPAVIVVMALTLLASESRIVPAPKARLASQDSMVLMIPAGTGTAAGGGGPGAGVASQNSHLWILSMRRPSESERKLLGASFEGLRFNLGAYRVEPWGGWSKQGQVTFLAARDVSYDTKLISLDAKGLQEYTQTRKAWDDAIEKIKD